jgi:hypothetical protein
MYGHQNELENEQLDFCMEVERYWKQLIPYRMKQLKKITHNKLTEEEIKMVFELFKF